MLSNRLGIGASLVYCKHPSRCARWQVKNIDPRATCGHHQPPSPSPKVKTVFYELIMQRNVKTVFSEHVMCVFYFVSRCLLRVLRKS